MRRILGLLMACLVVSACEPTMGLPGQQAPAEASDVPAAPEDSRPRVRLPGDVENRPNRWLSVVGWARGAQAGRARMEVRYEPSLGGGLFGQQDVFRHEGGDFAWSRFEADLSLPPEPARPNSWNATRALRLFLFHSAPRAGAGLLAFDDLAVVAWEEAARGEPLTLETPHPRDFLRLEATEGTYTVRLTLRTHALPLP